MPFFVAVVVIGERGGGRASRTFETFQRRYGSSGTPEKNGLVPAGTGSSPLHATTAESAFSSLFSKRDLVASSGGSSRNYSQDGDGGTVTLRSSLLKLLDISGTSQ